MIRVVGIDGGGTRTRCLIADGAGAVLGKGEAGPANCATLAPREVVAAVTHALSQACRDAGCSAEGLDVVCAGLAGFYPPWHSRTVAEALGEALRGVGWEMTPHPPAPSPSRTDGEGESRAIPVLSPPLHPSLMERGRGGEAAGSTLDPQSSNLLLLPDLVIAWAGGTALQPGVVLVSGTGSVAYGRNAEGDTARAGGWGYLAGDEGSAYWIGREALTAFGRALDGRSPLTRLTQCLLHRFPNGHTEPEEWLRALYRAQWSPGQIAGLAPAVIEAAAEGDPAAVTILDQAGRHLGALAGHVLRTLRLEHAKVPVVVAGGILEQAGPVRAAAAAELRTQARESRLEAARFPPVAGAVLLALARCGVTVSEAIVERLSVDRVTGV